MTLDAFLVRLLVGAAAIVLAEVVYHLRHTRAARCRRSPAVLYGTERSDDR
jgi:hypothetical protein